MANTTHISGQWQRTKNIVADALELPHTKRESFVAETCGSDGVLHAEVLDLLRSFDTAGDMLSEQGVPGKTLADALASPGVARGTLIGRYEVHSLLGSGGMGSVFEAFDTSLQRPVALKLLSIGLASTGARKRFDAEAAALARLDHPNVARVFEIGVYDSVAPGVVGRALSVPFFAMELVQGAKTIDKHCRDAGTNVRDTLDLFARVCDAIHHGHQKSVLHRDIKPRNILVDAQGNPKVIDFGVSKLLDASAATVTQAQDIVGTPAYMPPEAFDKGVHTLDTRADVYSLGITLYELLQGAPAFDVTGLTPIAANKAIIAKPLPLLGNRSEKCRGDIETIVAKAIAKDPDDRYQSVDQFAADLRRVLAYEPILAKPAPIWKQARLFAKRHKAVMLAATVVVAAITIGVAGLAIGLARAKESEHIAKLEANRANRVSAFMLNMIRSGSPANVDSYSGPKLDFDTTPATRWPSAAPEGSAPTVGDLLFMASSQVESSFPDDPKLQADIASLLAQTSSDLSDKRARALALKAEQVLEKTYSHNDIRTIIARSRRYGGAILAYELDILPELQSDIDVVLARKNDSDTRLLNSQCATLAACYSYLGKPHDALPTLMRVRSQLDKQTSEDNQYKITLDMLVLRVQSDTHSFEQTLAGLQDCLRRSELIAVDSKLMRVNMLFEIMALHRNAGDLIVAQELTVEGLAASVEVFGNESHSAYEWLSNLFAISMQLGDIETTECAARMQLEIAQKLLGPSSGYTTKSLGRVARTLLGANRNLGEAQRAARLAIDTSASDLEIGEGWALYHELLWAWAIRMQGDPQRAQEIILDRMDIESRAGRSRAAIWVEVIRWTQLAECEMDLAEQDSGRGLADAERCVREAVCHAEEIGYDWPSSKFAYAAQDRLRAMIAARAK